jgi:hypothetical protein
MGNFDGIITASFKQLFVDAIDALLENTALTVPCQLLFENTTFTECPNCILDVMSGRSSNIYKSGGPIAFTQGYCPYCNGVGRITTDNTINLNIIVIWNYKDWIGWAGVPDNTMTPFGQCQTLSKMSTISDIKNAKEIILDTDIESHVKHRFSRISEPNPIGLGADSYIVTMWKRIG